MERRNERTAERRDDAVRATLEHQLLLIPEAPILLALLFIGWAYDFPPAVGAFAALVVLVFIVRLSLMTVAAQQLERAKYRHAQCLSRAALRIYPWSADALMLQAHSLYLQGEDARAEPLLQRAARLAPDSDLIRGALAGTLLARGKYAAAREHANQALRVDSRSPFATQHLAWLSLHVDDDPVAAQRLLAAVDLEHLAPSHAAPLLILLAEAQAARGARQAALETLRQIEAMLSECPLPQQAETFYHLGRLHHMLGDAAAGLFQRSVDLDPHGRYARVAWRAAMERDEPARPLAAS